MIKGKTKSGFEYAIERKRLNNYELIEALAELDKNSLLLPKVLILILGKEQKNKLVKHVKGDEEIADIDKMNQEIVEIFHVAQETKNS